MKQYIKPLIKFESIEGGGICGCGCGCVGSQCRCEYDCDKISATIPDIYLDPDCGCDCVLCKAGRHCFIGDCGFAD